MDNEIEFEQITEPRPTQKRQLTDVTEKVTKRLTDLGITDIKFYQPIYENRFDAIWFDDGIICSGTYKDFCVRISVYSRDICIRLGDNVEITSTKDLENLGFYYDDDYYNLCNYHLDNGDFEVVTSEPEVSFIICDPQSGRTIINGSEEYVYGTLDDMFDESIPSTLEYLEENIEMYRSKLTKPVEEDLDIEFTELKLDDTLTRREKEKVAHYFWDIGTQEAAAYLRSRGIDTTLFDEIHADKLSEEGFDADYPFEDMSDADYYRAADAESEAFMEFLTRVGLDEVVKHIDGYFDDLLDDDELIESTSLKEEDEESTDVVEVDEIEFSDKPTSDLLDFVMDAIYDEFDGNVTVEYNEEYSDEPDYLEFEITDESEEYGGNNLIVVTDSRADELLRQEVESYVDDCLPDLIECGNIALEDYLDEDWFDDYRRDWYEEWVLYGMDTEELVDELVTNEHLDWDELADLIVYEDDEVDIAATAEALDNNYRALDSIKYKYVDELCSQHESAVEWYLDHVGKHDLKYLLKDNEDAFDKEAYIDDLVGDASYDRGNWLGRYNGCEYYFGNHDGNTYYAYIQ